MSESKVTRRKPGDQGVDDNGGNSNHPSATLQHPLRAKENLGSHIPWVVFVMKVIASTLVFFYFIIPAFVKIYPAVLNHVAFLNHLRWPPMIDLSQPGDFGLVARNFLHNTESEISVGVWHMLPSTLAKDPPSNPDEFNKLLSKGPSVILYLHGNAGTRAGWHRIQLYKVLIANGFHVVTFDYRGYGDSSGSPSEEGLMHDSVSMFHWVKQHSGKVPVYIWGHSLGSAVATKTAKKLAEREESFDGMILESPFNNFVDASSNHPFSLPFRFLPWYTWCFIEGIKANHIQFSTDENIAGVKAPTIILHAVDDGVVPYSLGRKLFEVAQRTKKAGSIEFRSFDGELGYGHKHIHKDPYLGEIITNFTSAHRSS